MKILVLGASGMAGHVVATYFREQDHEVETVVGSTPLDKGSFVVDVRDTNALEPILRSKNYDAIINCIGLLVKDSESNKDLAVYLNSYLPRYLEKKFEGKTTRIIHISTDGVFAASKTPYQEDSTYNAEHFYGRTKALGEINNTKDLTFRMSIVGPELKREGKSLFGWFYAQEASIDGYTNSSWNGVTTIELAKAILDALERNITGIYNLAPATPISKYELLVLFRKVFNKESLNINPAEGNGLNVQLVNTREDFTFALPTYPKMIEEMKDWIKDHPSIYRHYGKS